MYRPYGLYGPCHEEGTTVEVWQANQPQWRGRIIGLRYGHQRPYVVSLEAEISRFPSTQSRVGAIMAFDASQVRLPDTTRDA